MSDDQKVPPAKVLSALADRALGKSGLDRAINSLTLTIFNKHVDRDADDVPQSKGMDVYDDLLRSMVLISNYIASIEAKVKGK